MSWILEPLEHAHFQRALMICLLAGFSNGYISAFVVLRKSALQVGSLSHSLLPGLAVGVVLFRDLAGKPFPRRSHRSADRRPWKPVARSKFAHWAGNITGHPLHFRVCGRHPAAGLRTGSNRHRPFSFWQHPVRQRGGSSNGVLGVDGCTAHSHCSETSNHSHAVRARQQPRHLAFRCEL